ncbi:DEAD/DEAH box helicase [Sphingomonas cannabina]|uniref:DEAD/DEAH box helicase n=1 Tax=Sphingomonas cannabina TaxID=2899123 RepID=UPI001F2C4F6A|nr:DEAD/DEAH box helicase [Sphingomonas cannabina]UIJ44763.1 DEAD/DEAH box helicase [Sphingomonas cannabina]
MAELEAERRALAEAFLAVHATENALTAQQARLFVRSIQSSWRVTSLDWSVRQSVELFTDARRLLHAATIFEEGDGPDGAAAASCYRRAGEILEWLTRAGDDVTHDVPAEVLAAGAYQLAGLPAMAGGILKRVKLDGVGAILGAFLGCDFDSVMELTAAFWARHGDLTGPDGSEGLLADTDDEPPQPMPSIALEADEDGDAPPESRTSRVAWYVAVETVRSIGLLADGLRRGELIRTETALQKLAALADVATRIVGDEAWIMLKLVRASAARFARDSLHRRAAPLAALSPDAAAKLHRFAREQFARGRGVLWPSQVSGLARLAAGRSFALCTPTGSGKTLVANLALVKELLLTAPADGKPSPLALYIVPSRALAGEVEAKLSAEFRSEITVTGLYGGTDWGITDYWLTADTSTVLIATVEKAEALIRYVGHLLVRRLELLIIDEAHQVVVDGSPRTMRNLAAHSDRAMRLEGLVTRLLALKPGIARVALTAVAGGAAPPVARWIEGDDAAEPVGLGYRSSRQLVGVLESRPGQSARITLELNNGQPLYVRGREDPVFLNLSLPPMPEPLSAIRNSLPHYVQNHALWTAMNLVPGGRRILISVTQAPDRVMKRYAEAFTLKGWDALPPFAPPADGVQLFADARAACVDYCGPASSEVALLDRGIATSHGQMPQRLRRLMVELIEKRVCPVTVATATLTEGVNLPFDLIILPSLERTVDIRPTGQPVTDILPTAEFRNLAGRAGRPGAAESMEGMTLVCLPMANSSTAPAEQATQRNQRDGFVRNLNRLLDAIAAESRADATVSTPLQTLLRSIWQKAHDVLGLRTVADLHAFLEASLPESVGDNLGVGSTQTLDMLGDSLDELDGFILSAIEEMERLSGAPADVEAAIRDIWSRSFTRYAGVAEEWLEAAFVKRGEALAARLYPDPVQRRALYQIGFTPYVGRQFQQVSPAILEALRGAADYGTWGNAERFALVGRLGELVRGGRGFGFTARGATEQALIDRWLDVAGWWVQRDGASPPAAGELRRWQGFVANNLEFRLGVSVGAAVAEAWNANAGEAEVPNLAEWRETTKLPWIGFWFRELLRWGTLDPFVAFAMAQGLGGTREAATVLRAEYETWLASRTLVPTAEERIDPQLFLAWMEARPRGIVPPAVPTTVAAGLTRVTGSRASYAVRPIIRDGTVTWIDPAGFEVGTGQAIPGAGAARPSGHDYVIANDQFGVRVTRTF